MTIYYNNLVEGRLANQKSETCFQILKLSHQFFLDYPSSKFPELLEKRERIYYCMILELHNDLILCIPYRTQMNHNNGYHFKSSKRSKLHQSGLDYSKIVIIKETKYLSDQPTIVDNDEYNETVCNIEKIERSILKYLRQYINHILGVEKLHQKEFSRKYKYSTLSYFHEELGIMNS